MSDKDIDFDRPREPKRLKRAVVARVALQRRRSALQEFLQ